MRFLSLFLSGLLLLPTAVQAQIKQTHPIEIKYAWARATGKSPTAAIYMLLKNTSDTDDVLMGVETDKAHITEIHKNVVNPNGVLEMTPAHQGDVTIPAGEALLLEPGGLHVMLMGMKEPLKDGYEFPVKVKFKHHPWQNVTVKIMPANYKYNPQKEMP